MVDSHFSFEAKMGRRFGSISNFRVGRSIVINGEAIIVQWPVQGEESWLDRKWANDEQLSVAE